MAGMVSVFMAAFLALAPSPQAGASPGPAALDLQCYHLMAQLAENADPRVSAAGLTGAQYFLGRIDASAPGFDPDGAGEEAGLTDPQQSQLVGQCGALMGAGGRDFRAIGQPLARQRPTV